MGHLPSQNEMFLLWLAGTHEFELFPPRQKKKKKKKKKKNTQEEFESINFYSGGTFKARITTSLVDTGYLETGVTDS